jgi:hypothetical protein
MRHVPARTRVLLDELAAEPRAERDQVFAGARRIAGEHEWPPNATAWPVQPRERERPISARRAV